MKFLDLLRMSSSNLWKRKVRTILTVLGVVIGVASIVVMISLGLGLSRSLIEQYESYGSLTQIEVMAPYDMGGNTDTEVKRLNDDLVEELGRIEHVESVYPVMQVSGLAVYGGYEGYLNIQGMPLEALEGLEITVGEGSLPSVTDDSLKFFYGATVLQDFYNAKTGSGYRETGELPDIDLMEDPIFIIFDMEAYYQSMGGGTDSNGQSIKPPKKYL
ncbi:MAG: ABC transporter permease, partial [Lachnospiraceae bacterium]|nr:ABC transporter permease [Lachnospiraceae bacterium]